MADALRHLTRLGVYKAAMPVSRKFFGIFCDNKYFIINCLKALISVGRVIPKKQSTPHVIDYFYKCKQL